MGIRNNADANIIRRSIELECSELAKNHLFLYRGSTFFDDASTNFYSARSHSLSYGQSLFAGCLFDGGATAFHHMRSHGKEYNHAYMIPVHLSQWHESPFFVHTTTALPDLGGFGEMFHARTKMGKGSAPTTTHGIQGPVPTSEICDKLISQLSQEQLNSQFEQYIRHALHLHWPLSLSSGVSVIMSSSRKIYLKYLKKFT